ncbi:MAG: hypothetical protein BGN92_02715 [Sphingobacteriales bacterium 41-5]|nr:MAG: hypothetical protein BGN92_02715 [Sphingobacteriales bacterium 41-5]
MIVTASELLSGLLRRTLQGPAILFGFLLFSCNVAKKSFNPYKKFSPQQLQTDFDLYQNILEERHPSLYWCTPEHSLDKAFREAKEQIADSLSEYDFRKIITVVNSQIQCGHTSIKASKQYLKYVDTQKTKSSRLVLLKR